MRIGVMADSHDNLSMIRRAGEVFRSRGVKQVLHAGDFVAPFSVLALKEAWGEEFSGVFGNNDGERLGLQRASGGRIHPSPWTFQIGPWSIFLSHELPEEAALSLAKGGGFRLIVYAHTHKPEVRVEGQTLILNPGETGGWLYGRCTVAIVDLEGLQGEIIDL